jgi:hypothetical protein
MNQVSKSTATQSTTCGSFPVGDVVASPLHRFKDAEKVSHIMDFLLANTGEM